MSQEIPTYSFAEAIDRIVHADREELDLLAAFLTEEKYCYCLFHLQLLQAAFELKRKCLIAEAKRQ